VLDDRDRSRRATCFARSNVRATTAREFTRCDDARDDARRANSLEEEEDDDDARIEEKLTDE
jgi:hypothetical protein|tara:strand:+ start:310 stop:495 length:186 start_codon:yes stop_codon:yes gene_type:complete